MDKYLDRINKGKSSSSFMSKFKSSKKPDEIVPDVSETETHIEYKEPSFFKRLMQWSRRNKVESDDELSEEEKIKLMAMENEVETIEEEEDQLQEVEEELEEKKAGIIKTLMQKLGFYSAKEEDFEALEEELYEEPVVPSDVSEVLKITYSWLEKLPARQKKAFKESDDFEKYKEVLTKYGLVKKKDVEQVKNK